MKSWAAGIYCVVPRRKVQAAVDWELEWPTHNGCIYCVTISWRRCLAFCQCCVGMALVLWCMHCLAMTQCSLVMGGDHVVALLTSAQLVCECACGGS